MLYFDGTMNKVRREMLGKGHFLPIAGAALLLALAVGIALIWSSMPASEERVMKPEGEGTNIPPIDREAPVNTKTAAFAMG